jgi:hypothetical protein
LCPAGAFRDGHAQRRKPLLKSGCVGYGVDAKMEDIRLQVEIIVTVKVSMVETSASPLSWVRLFYN